MKHILYILLLVVEALLDLLALGQIYSWFGAVACVVIAAVTAALLTMQIKSLNRAKAVGDASAAKKTRRRVALVLALPAVLAIAVGIFVIVSMLLYFG